MLGAAVFTSCLAAISLAQYAPAPLYSACSPAVPCAGGLACQASVCVPYAAAPALLPAPAPVYAAPVPVAPAPLYAAPAPIAPVIAAQPPACAPHCIGGGACISGACQCAAPVVYSPVVGCAPAPAPLPYAPVPVVAGRLIPQALPGAPCEPGVECTGGSVCSLGVCVCPPELVQEGTVCVARTVYGVVPPPVVPVPFAPAPVAMVPVGAPCAPMAAAPMPPPACVPGAVCGPAGVCACGAAYTPVQGACVRRRHAKQAEKDE